MKKLVKVVALIAVLALMTLLVPCAAPLCIEAANAEEDKSSYPVYAPVELGKTAVIALDYTQAAPYKPHTDGFLADNAGYVDESLSIRIEKFRAYDTTCLATWVQVADASQLRTELCKAYPSEATARADVLAKRVHAVLAINGDWFVHRNAGYIVRNGKLLRSRYNADYDTLVIDGNGDFTIVPATEEALAPYVDTAVQTFTFGPGLVIDGVMATEFPLRENAPEKETQRIALAQMGPLSYLIVTTEGPENKGSTGLTMKEFAQLLYDLGAVNAYNLDGGASSSLVLNYKKINSLSTGKIRSVGDIVYFVTAVPGAE